MSAERIDPAVIAAARLAYEKGTHSGNVARMVAAIRAADEKRGLRVEILEPDPRSTTQFAPQWRYVSDWQSSDDQTQADPEGQEYAYRICWEDARDDPACSGCLSLGEAMRRRDSLAIVGAVVWVERALLGPWEKIS